MNSIVNQEDIGELLNRDPVFDMILNKYGVPPDWKRPEGFMTLSRIILEQLVSLSSAKAHFEKLNGYLPSFTPEEILKLTDVEMRNCQISRQKAKSLKALAEAVVTGNLELDKLRNLPGEKAKKLLMSVHGIGDWTSDIYLVFALQEKDIFPIGDVAIVNTMKELTGCSQKEEILKYAENWKAYRSLAAYFLWHYYLSTRGRTALS